MAKSRLGAEESLALTSWQLLSAGTSGAFPPRAPLSSLAPSPGGPDVLEPWQDTDIVQAWWSCQHIFLHPIQGQEVARDPTHLLAESLGSSGHTGWEAAERTRAGEPWLA